MAGFLSREVPIRTFPTSGEGKTRARAARLLREPLLHFLVLGAALFALHRAVAGPAEDKERIVVGPGQVENLAATFARTWMRPPTADELSGLVRDYVREEVACREAQALGLDRDDTVIRRRLRQKLEFVSEEAAQSDPGETALAAYLAARPEVFRGEDRVTFDQIFLDPGRRGEELERDAERMLAELRRKSGAPGDLGALSDATLLDTRFVEATPSEIGATFGREFVERLRERPQGSWQGPVSSGFGLHLVYVERWEAGVVPPLDTIRSAVLREWQNERRVESLDAMYERLLAGYEVVIETPSDAAGAGPRPATP